MRLPIQKLAERLQRLRTGINCGLVYHGLYARRVAFGFRVADPLRRTEFTFGDAGEAAKFLQTLSHQVNRPQPAS